MAGEARPVRIVFMFCITDSTDFSILSSASRVASSADSAMKREGSPRVADEKCWFGAKAVVEAIATKRLIKVNFCMVGEMLIVEMLLLNFDSCKHELMKRMMG